jgi:hypothetical protein
MIFDLLYLDGRSLMRLPYESAARGCRAGLSARRGRRRPPRRRRRGAARGLDARRGSKGSWPSGSTARTARAALAGWVKVKNVRTPTSSSAADAGARAGRVLRRSAALAIASTTTRARLHYAGKVGKSAAFTRRTELTRGGQTAAPRAARPQRRTPPFHRALAASKRHALPVRPRTKRSRGIVRDIPRHQVRNQQGRCARPNLQGPVRDEPAAGAGAVPRRRSPAEEP